MMPAWHQLVSMSGHVEESEKARKLQLYATSIYQVHSFVCQLDYTGKAVDELCNSGCSVYDFKLAVMSMHTLLGNQLKLTHYRGYMHKIKRGVPARMCNDRKRTLMSLQT